MGTFRGIYQHRTVRRDQLDQLQEPEGGMCQELIPIFVPLISTFPIPGLPAAVRQFRVRSYSYNKTNEMH